MNLKFEFKSCHQQDTTKGRGGRDDESGLGSGGGHELEHDHEHEEHIEEEKEEKKSLKARLQAVQEVTALVQVSRNHATSHTLFRYTTNYD